MSNYYNFSSAMKVTFTFLIFFISTSSCKENDAIDTSEGVLSSASDFMPNEVREFGERLNESFETHVSKLSTVANDVSLEDMLEMAHETHKDHFNEEGLSDSELQQLKVNTIHNDGFVKLNDSTINNAGFSKNGTNILKNIQNIISTSASHREFQLNLSDLADEMRSVNLSENEKIKIQHMIVILEHSAKYMNGVRNSSGRVSCWFCVLECVASTAAGATLGALQGGATGSVVPLAGTVTGAVIGGIAGGVAGAVGGC